jgi:hypothetical protein
MTEHSVLQVQGHDFAAFLDIGRGAVAGAFRVPAL